MAQITLTLDLTPETLEILKLLASASNADSGADTPKNEKPATDDGDAEKNKKAPKKSAGKEKKETPKEEPAESAETGEAKDDGKAPSLTDVRAVALKLSKAGKQAQLKEIFAKYGAAKLSDIAEEHYADLMADLEAVNE